MPFDTTGVSERVSPLARLLAHIDRGPQGSHARKVGGKAGGIGDLYLIQLIPAVLLVLVGVITMWSASLTISEASFPRHLLGIALGAIAAAVIWRYDYRQLSNMSKVLLILDIVLMVLPRVPGLGATAKGMTGWVQLPFVHFRFQPSEVAKLVTIFLMASVTAEFNGKIETFRDYAKTCGILCIPFLLILALPDLGTGLIILVIGATIITCGGAKRRWVLATVALIVLVATVAIVTSMTDGLPHVLRDYQLNRLIVFADPSVDPTGDGYNLQQAKIAVGSGGFFGKGFCKATQAANGFLPEAHTDFVFALFAEQFGFVGSVVLLVLFAWMILSTVLLAMRVESMFSKLVLVGCAAMWAFQLLQNVGMCIGIMPITGIPLPFISFGSSSMLVQISAIGMVQSVWKHRKKSA